MSIISASTHARRPAEEGEVEAGFGPDPLAPGEYTVTVGYTPHNLESGGLRITILPRTSPDHREVERVRDFAGGNSEDHPTYVVRVRGERLGWYLKKHVIYHADIYNPASVIAGPGSFRSTIVLRNGEMIHVNGDANAAALLSAQGHKVPDQDTALDLALAFAELRGYRLRHDRPFNKPSGGGVPSDAACLATERTSTGWLVTLPLFEDRGCTRYEIAVSRQGEIRARAAEVIFSLGRYR